MAHDLDVLRSQLEFWIDEPSKIRVILFKGCDGILHQLQALKTDPSVMVSDISPNIKQTWLTFISARWRVNEVSYGTDSDNITISDTDSQLAKCGVRSITIFKRIGTSN